MIFIKVALLLGVFAVGLLVPKTSEAAELPMGKDDPELAHVIRPPRRQHERRQQPRESHRRTHGDLALHRLPAHAERDALHQ